MLWGAFLVECTEASEKKIIEVEKINILN